MHCNPLDLTFFLTYLVKIVWSCLPFVAIKINLILCDSLLALMEAMSTTFTNEAWRLKNIQAEHTQFSPPEGLQQVHLSAPLSLSLSLSLAYYLASLSFCLIRVNSFLFLACMMATSLRKCAGTVNRVCNRFLPAVDKNPHSLCTACRGKECNTDNLCGECYMWSKVSVYRIKLASQREKKERKGKVAAASSFSGFSSSMPVPLKCLLTSFETAVVSTVAASIDTCQVTYTALYYVFPNHVG